MQDDSGNESLIDVPKGKASLVRANVSQLESRSGTRISIREIWPSADDVDVFSILGLPENREEAKRLIKNMTVSAPCYSQQSMSVVLLVILTLV